MKRENVTPGMKVRISDNLDITSRRCTANGSMMKMKNKVYKVKKISGRNIVHIYNNNGRGYWAFAIEDISPAELPYQQLKTKNLANIKSEFFNPEYLIGD